MKLPNDDQAIIDLRKLTEYALSPTHDEGRHKAALFRDLLGITLENVDLLVDALRRAASDAEAQTGRRDQYGQRYSIDFEFVGPTGRAIIRSAWIVAAGETIPRLITCYILIETETADDATQKTETP
jgi:hypothetical protein